MKSRGPATMPMIIALAAAVILLQIPLLYKSKGGAKFSVGEKAAVSALALAEAGLDDVITDLGRRALTVPAGTDTVPYRNVGLGRGSYTARLKSGENPARAEVISTGRVGGNFQSISARLELVSAGAAAPAAGDTLVRVRILSWERAAGNLAHGP